MTKSDQQLIVLGLLLAGAVVTGVAVKPKTTTTTASGGKPQRAPKEKNKPARVSGRGRRRRTGGIRFPR